MTGCRADAAAPASSVEASCLARLWTEVGIVGADEVPNPEGWRLTFETRKK